MKQIVVSLLLLGCVGSVSAQSDSEKRVIVIKMVDKSTAEWRFEPAAVEVRRGDTIRWVQEDIVPHNVEFKEVPQNAALDDVMMGPYVFANGDVYELEIDERFVDGTYDYICTPHAPLGMKASFTVAPASGDATNK